MLLAIALLGNADAAKADKVDVCHNDDTGYHIINISENAVDKHVDNHGDWEVTDEVCGDGLDNDCDGEVDEDCCPCDDYFVELDSTTAYYSYCETFDDGYDGSYYSDVTLFDYYGSDIYVYTYTVDWGSYYESYGYSDYECYVSAYDYGTGTYESQTFALTADEHEACGDAIVDYAATVGETCN